MPSAKAPAKGATAKPSVGGMLRQWAAQSVESQRTVSPTGKAQSLKLALAAEERVADVLREAGWKYVFTQRRVPVSSSGHNREIDVIAIGPVILVVEVKNWRGQVWANGPRWYQCANPPKGRALEFENVMEDTALKATALRRLIENKYRVPLPDFKEAQGWQGGLISPTNGSSGARPPGGGIPAEAQAPSTAEAAGPAFQGTWYGCLAAHKAHGACVVPVVVFASPGVVLDPNSLSRMEHVFTLRSFESFARAVIRWDQVPDGVVARAQVVLAAVGAAALAGLRFAAWYLARWCVALLRRAAPNAAPTAAPSASPAATPRRLRAPSYHSSVFGTPGNSKRPPYSLPPATQRQVASALEEVRTWDIVTLHNGAVIHGDVSHIIVPSAGLMYHRHEMMDMSIEWSTGLTGLLWSLWVGGVGLLRVQLIPSMRRESIRTRRSSARSGREVFTSDGNVHCYLRGARTAQDLRVADRVALKKAGSPHLEEVALQTIASIELSQHMNLSKPARATSA